MRHDTYGFALTAHSGTSQGRPNTNASSRLIVRHRPAQPACSQVPGPGWSHHSAWPTAMTETGGTAPFIPDTNLLERLFLEPGSGRPPEGGANALPITPPVSIGAPLPQLWRSCTT